MMLTNRREKTQIYRGRIRNKKYTQLNHNSTFSQLHIEMILQQLKKLTMATTCLRTLQKEAFVKILDSADKKILSKNTSEGDATTTSATSSLGPIVWKVLLLDASTQVMMGPLFKVSELYEHNITLFM